MLLHYLQRVGLGSASVTLHELSDHLWKQLVDVYRLPELPFYRDYRDTQDRTKPLLAVEWPVVYIGRKRYSSQCVSGSESDTGIPRSARIVLYCLDREWRPRCVFESARK